MAGSSGPDLSAAVSAVDNLMDDVCTIETLEDGPEDPDTGVIEQTPTEIYSGKCMLRAERAAAGAEPQSAGYRAHLPVTAPAIPRGARLTCTDSRRDSRLIGLQFRVLEEPVGTFTISHKLMLELVRR